MDKLDHLEDLTDLGNAKRLARIGEGKIAYIREKKEWYGYTGIRWEENTTGLLPHIEEMLKELKEEGTVFNSELFAKLKEQFGDDPIPSGDTLKETIESNPELNDLASKRNDVAKWYKMSQSKQRIDAAKSLASGQSGMNVSITDFDSKGQFVGTLNGVLDIRTGNLITNDPSCKVTKFVNANYDPEATCPNWEKSLLEYMCGDEEQVKLLQKLAGVALSGVEKDKMFFLVGSGDNGKSTYQKTLAQLFHTYAGQAPAKIFTSDDGKSEYYKAGLYGIRLLNITETKEDAYLAGTLVKECLESGEITGRDPGGKPFPFQPIFTGIVSTNWLPNIGDDPAVWKRLVIIKWNYLIPSEKKDRLFIQKMFVPEFSGILNWAIRGYQLFLEEGWNLPETIAQTILSEREEQDKVQQFIDSYCTITNSEDDYVEGIAFRNLYSQWCQGRGQQAEGSKILNEKLRKKGLRVEKYQRQMHVFGLKFSMPVDRQTRLDQIRAFLEEGDNIRDMVDFVERRRRKSGEKEKMAFSPTPPTV